MQSNALKTHHHLVLDAAQIAQGRVSVDLKGPFGGIVRREFIPVPGETAVETVTANVVKEKDSNPGLLSSLPALCPRVAVENGRLVYEGRKDVLNSPPTLQVLDPDALALGEAERTVSQFDCKHNLFVERVEILFDYEDPSRVKAARSDGQEVRETHSGFYANFHAAVLPYRKEWASLSAPDMLRLAQGGQVTVGHLPVDALRWRTHVFLPGPFLSRRDFFYSLCEWGDTAFQAPHQEMDYRDMAVWDWDYPVGDAVLLVIWEGDEEAPLVRSGVLSSSAIMDDWVAAFRVSRQMTEKGVRLVNEAGDFSIWLKTGDRARCGE